MIEKLKESSGNVVGFRLSGKLTDADYKAMGPELVKGHRKIRENQSALVPGGFPRVGS
jgi:hypothetical protein